MYIAENSHLMTPSVWLHECVIMPAITIVAAETESYCLKFYHTYVFEIDGHLPFFHKMLLHKLWSKELIIKNSPKYINYFKKKILSLKKSKILGGRTHRKAVIPYSPREANYKQQQDKKTNGKQKKKRKGIKKVGETKTRTITSFLCNQSNWAEIK